MTDRIPMQAIRGAALPNRAGLTPLAPNDRPWGAYRMSLVAAPLVGCTLSDLRAGLVTLLHEDPGCRALQRILWQEPAWERVPVTDAQAHVERLASDYTGPSLAPEGVCEELLAEAVDDLPFRVVLGPDFLAVRINHVLGDAVAVETMLPWLTSLASGGPPVPLSRPGHVTGRPYRSALRETFGRRVPARALLDSSRFILASRTAGKRAAAAPAGAASGPMCIETTTADADLLQKWRRANCPRTSPGVVLIAAAWQALIRAGVLGRDDTPSVMLDLRRYLPRGVHVEGNFANALQLAPGTPCTLSGVKNAIDSSVDSGVPLISAAAQAGLQVTRAAVPLRRRPGAAPALAVRPGRGVFINVTGRHRRYDDMPWATDTGLVSLEGPTVDSADGLTFCISQLKDGYHVTACFYDTGLSRATVRLAMTEFSHLADILDEIQDV